MFEPGEVMTGRDMSFPPRCKSESYSIIISTPPNVLPKFHSYILIFDLVTV